MRVFVLKFLVIVTIVLGCIMFYNYKNDASGLFDKDFSVLRTEPNQRFVKVRYLLENPDKYDGFCFGSSRVGHINPEHIDNGHRYYNMTYSEGIPEEWLADIKIMVAHGVRIRQLLLGIDEISYKIDPKVHESQYLRLPYRENNFSTYMAFLLKDPLSEKKLGNEMEHIFDIYNTGLPLHPWVDEQIEQDIEAHLQGEQFKHPYHHDGNRISETIAALREIKNIADANGAELIVFISPIHQVTYLDNDINQFNEFKRELAQVVNYYDFSGLNKVTTNNYYFYETSHYRMLTGDMILERIFHMPPETETDFGYYVTRNNVDQHLEMLSQEIGDR